MPDEPVITYVLSVMTDERGSALKGEAAVMQGGVAIHHVSLDREAFGTHASGVVCDLLHELRTALEAMSASKPDDTPPPQPEQAPRKPRQKSKTTASRGVSMSRLR